MDIKIPLILSMLLLACACNNSGGGPNLLGAGEVPLAGVSPAPSAPSTSVQKLTYKVGPFNLPAGQKASVMWDSPGAINFSTTEPLWVTSFEPVIEDATGGKLPDRLLNLAIVSNGGEKNPLCTDKETARPFFAANAVTKKIELPDGYGYKISKDSQLDAKVILQNPTTQDFENVFFKFTITAEPMKVAKNVKDVIPLFLDLDPCDHMPISIAPKSFTKKQATFIVPEDGLLTKVYGILQDFGVGVSLFAKDQPTPIWDGKAKLSTDHEILSLPPFEDPAGIPLKAGDTLSLSVAYDNVDDWQTSASGSAMAYLIKTESSAMPQPVVPSTTATDTQKMLLK